MNFLLLKRIKNFALRKYRLINSFDKLFYFNFHKNSIPVYWAHCKGISNFGDQLNPYLISRITNKSVEYVKQIPLLYSNKLILVPIGSIIDDANRFCIVWGSGIILYKTKIKKLKFLAVRGPRTQKRMTDLGITPPKTIGDPALLLPLYYNKKVALKHKYGIIPHYVDFNHFEKLIIPENVNIIDITKEIEFVIDEIRSCNQIISSSLHGLIVANAYGIDCAWAKFSDNMYGDDVKFFDYFESINIFHSKVIEIAPFKLINSLDNLNLKFYNVDKNKLNILQNKLLDVFPFKQ